MNIKAAEQNLLDAKCVMDSMGIPFFLSNGTLLGYYRDGHLMGHDRDVDIGVKITDFKDGIADKFIEAGFIFRGSNGRKENGSEYSFIKRDIGLDMFFYYDTPRDTWMAVWDDKDNRYKYTYPPISGYKTIIFLGEEFNIPTNTEQYLEAQYGDWKEPVTKWDPFKSPKNIENDYWEEFYKSPHTLEPSPFAIDCNFSGKKILDLGCGNGRDTLYFAKNNEVIGIDKIASVGNNFSEETIEKFIEKEMRVDVLYCRFLFHTINHQLQGKILQWGKAYAGRVYIECRSDKGTVPDYSHYRRLINSDELIRECLDNNYKIEYFIEDTGLAKIETEDPVIIRLRLKS